MITKRMIAFTIDYTIFWIFFSVYFFGGMSILTNYSEHAQDIFGLILFYSFIPILMSYFGFKDLLFKDQSIGKKIVKIKVVSIESKNIRKAQLISRNLILIYLYPIEVLMLLSSSKRLGDKYAKTNVVEI